MGDRSGMSISADSPSDETLDRGPLAQLLRRQYEFPFGINVVQFSIFHFFQFSIFKVTFIFIIRWTLCCCELIPSTKFVGSTELEIWTIVYRKLK